MSPFLQEYHALVEAGKINADPAQLALAQQLNTLQSQLAQQQWWRFWRPTPKGLYIYGAVGRGKTMLMDLFFSHCSYARKRRIHFHAFMSHIHHNLRRLRKHRRDKSRYDVLKGLAHNIAAEAKLLCLDEFFIHNIADASLLERLIRLLLEKKVVIVLTSNDAPDDLYAGGLNRARFLPCIALLKETLAVHTLNAQKDYRYRTKQPKTNWHHLRSDTDAQAFEKHFQSLCAPYDPQPRTISHRKRALFFAQSAPSVGRIPFADLCGLPLGAEDYLLLAQHFHTLVLDDIPAILEPRAESAMRFMTLVDVLYDNKMKLVASSGCALAELWQIDLPAQHPNLRRLYGRMRSRLEEMSQASWMQKTESLASAS